MPLLREFLNENIHRSYPFENQNAVPTALIVDFGIIATESVPNNSDNTGTTYINRIVTDGVTVQVGLGFDSGGSTTDLGFIATVEVDKGLYQTKRFQLAGTADGSGVVIEGFIVFGDLSIVTSMPPVTTLDATTGKIYAGCIQTMTKWLAGFKVGDVTLSGVVELVGGDGVEITADMMNNKINVSCTGAQSPVGNSVIVDDQTLLSELTARYGTPITTINVSRSGTNAGGDWQIVSDQGDVLAIEADSTTKSITIKDVSATPCCTDTNLQTLINNIASLNTRAGLLEEAQTQLETNINTVGTQLLRLM